MSKNTHWSKEEEETLMSMYLADKNTLCEQFKGRTWVSILAKINRLGLKRNLWTKEEEETLREIYSSADWKTIKQMLPGRTYRSISAKAERLGVKRISANKTKKTANDKGISKAKGFELDIPKKELYSKYFLEGLNVRQCEEHFKCSNMAILMRLKKWFPQEFYNKKQNIGRKYKISDISRLLALGNYQLIKYLGKNVLEDDYILTSESVIIKCDNVNHKPYKIKLNSLIGGNRCRECYFENNVGENNPAYNPDLTDEERQSYRFVAGYKIWRRQVYQKDKYTCKKCGDNKGGNLVAHHIESYNSAKDKRTDISNGLTLCEECHKDFHSKYGYGNNTRSQLKEWLTED